MDLFSKKEIKKLLKKHQISPSKRLGQNFLVDKSVVKKVVDAADLKPEDIILEIGPGIGTLTQKLADRVKKVIAVEKDPNMIAILGETLKRLRNVDLIQADIRRLKFQITKGEEDSAAFFFRLVSLSQNSASKFQANSKIQIPKNYKIVGNLPFYLTAPVIRQLLECTDARRLYAVFVVQKEVGQRICAKPPRMSMLAVSVQVYAETKIMGYIPKKSFWPQPKVDAAIIKILPLKIKSHDRRISSQRKNLFFKVVKAGFSQPRKQLINNLSKGLKLNRVKVENWLKKNSIQPTRRAETLEVQDWIKLTKSIKI